MEKKYKELRRFNLTKVLFSEVITKGNSDSLKFVFEKFDYSQKSEISYYLSVGERQTSVSINESLAQNFVATLPFDYYKQYITKDWINYGKDFDFPIACEFIRNTDFLEHIANNYYDKKETYSYDYERKFLRYILDIGNVVSTYRHNVEDELKGEDLFKSYFSLFKKCRLQFLEIKDHQVRQYDEFKKSVFKDDGLWLFEVEKYQKRFNSSEGISYTKDFITNLVENPSANIILKECFEQVKTKTKKTAKELSEFLVSDSTLVLAAFSGGNKYFLTNLIKKHRIPIEKIWEDFDNKLGKIIKKSYSINDNFEDREIKKFFYKEKNEKTFLWIKNNFGFGNYQFKNTAALSLFDNNEIKDFLKNNINLEFKENNNLSIKECILFSQMLNSFIGEKVKVNESFIYLMGEKLSELKIPKIQYENKNYLNVLEFSGKYIFPEVLKDNPKISIEYITNHFEKWSYQFSLDMKLIEKQETKSTKIKI